jgi:hypothetical protein
LRNWRTLTQILLIVGLAEPFSLHKFCRPRMVNSLIYGVLTSLLTRLPIFTAFLIGISLWLAL